MKYGLPYMGSKRRLSKKIVDYILEHNPNTKYVYDLFGGGGAISFEFLQRPPIRRVVYNELNTGVCNLLRDIQSNGVTQKYYQWVDRAAFHRHKNDDDWFGGLVKTCWSFGNDQSGYLFSQRNEELKKPLHEIIVDKSEKAIADFYNLSGVIIDKALLTGATINERRLVVMSFVRKAVGRFELEQLERLQQLEQLPRLEQLTIENKSFEEIAINTPIDETIIYLDPPYAGKKQYQKKTGIDDIYSYIKNSRYKIYLSSYESPLLECAAFAHTCSMAAKGTNKVTEKLFCNRTEN